MEKKRLKIIKTLGVMGIILLSVFVVTTQYQIEELKEKEMGKPLFLKVFADKTEGLLPLSVNFSAIVDYYQGDLKYKWDFGNGNTSKEASPNVVFETEKDYVCSLKVTDEEGNTKTDSINIIAKRNKPPQVILKINLNTISRIFNWLSLLSLVPLRVFTWPGNQQQFLDMIEERSGPNAWGEGRIIVTAQVSDPEDDEIVSYEWSEQTADSLGLANGGEVLPVHNLTGNESVTIPELYTWMDLRHIVTLTVTDSAGNKATGNIDFEVSKSNKMTNIKAKQSLIEMLFLTTVPQFTNLVWTSVPFINNIGTYVLDSIWLDLGPLARTAISLFLNVFRLDYEPPIPKADLEVSTIEDINLSAFVNDTTGEVESEAIVSSTFTITNNDTDGNVAKNIYISLYNSFNDDEGLENEIEKEDLIVSIEGIGGSTSNKLYYNGDYTKEWDNCYNIKQLGPGDSYTLDLAVLLKEGGVFTPGTYENCTLYIYQEKSLDIAEYVDEIPFTIII